MESKLIRLLFCCVFLCAACCVAAPKNRDMGVVTPPQGEFVYYLISEIPISPYGQVELSIHADGSGSATIEHVLFGEHRNDKFAFSLTQDEINALKAYADALDFFNLPEKDSEGGTDRSKHLLRIKIGEKKRDLTYYWRRQLEPIENVLWQIINRGLQYVELLSKASVKPEANQPYQLGYLLQPSGVRDILQRVVNKPKQEKVLLQLAKVTTPHEWVGIIAGAINQRDDAGQTQIMGTLSSFQFSAEFSRQHFDAVAPLLLQYLKQEYPNLSKTIYPASKRNVVGSVASALAGQRYAPAVPVLINGLRQFGVEQADFKLAHIGVAAITPLQELFSDENPRIRQSAVNTIAVILQLNQDMPEYAPLTAENKTIILMILRKNALPLLQKILVDDEDENVRKAAKSAIAQIELGWKH